MARIIIQSASGRSKAVVLPKDAEEYAIDIQAGSQVDISTLDIIDTHSANGSVFVLLEGGMTLILKGQGYKNLADEEYTLEDILAGEVPATAAGAPDFTVKFGGSDSQNTEFYTARSDVDIYNSGDSDDSTIEIGGTGFVGTEINPSKDIDRKFFDNNGGLNILRRTIIEGGEIVEEPPIEQATQRLAPELEGYVVDGKLVTLSFGIDEVAVVDQNGDPFMENGAAKMSYGSYRDASGDLIEFGKEFQLDRSDQSALIQSFKIEYVLTEENAEGELVAISGYHEVDVLLAYFSYSPELIDQTIEFDGEPIDLGSSINEDMNTTIKLVLAENIPDNAQLRITYEPSGGQSIKEDFGELTTYDHNLADLKALLDAEGDSIQETDSFSFDSLKEEIIYSPGTEAEEVVDTSFTGRGADENTNRITPINKNSGVETESLDVSGEGLTISGAMPEESIGASTSSIGDINGDGIDDYILGTESSGEGNQGAAYVVYGNADGADVNLDNVIDGEGGFRITGEADNALASSIVSGAGDVNGDGIDDILISQNQDAYVVYGKDEGYDAVNLTDLSGQGIGFKVSGAEPAEGTEGGLAISSAGDVNGDGIDDIIIADGGVANIIFGGKDGISDIDLSSSLNPGDGFTISSQDGNTGLEISNAGDINGDGVDDLVIVGDSAVYAVYGTAGETAQNIDLKNVAEGNGGFVVSDIAPSSMDGINVSAAGDFNGDGYDDFIIGVPNGDGLNGNFAAVVYGQASGENNRSSYVTTDENGFITNDLSMNDLQQGRGGFVITGAVVPEVIGVDGQVAVEAHYDDTDLGYSVSGAGDVNGDGFDDIIVSAPFANFDMLSAPGWVQVYKDVLHDASDYQFNDDFIHFGLSETIQSFVTPLVIEELIDYPLDGLGIDALSGLSLADVAGALGAIPAAFLPADVVNAFSELIELPVTNEEVHEVIQLAATHGESGVNYDNAIIAWAVTGALNGLVNESTFEESENLPEALVGVSPADALMPFLKSALFHETRWTKESFAEEITPQLEENIKLATEDLKVAEGVADIAEEALKDAKASGDEAAIKVAQAEFDSADAIEKAAQSRIDIAENILVEQTLFDTFGTINWLTGDETFSSNGATQFYVSWDAGSDGAPDVRQNFVHVDEQNRPIVYTAPGQEYQGNYTVINSYQYDNENYGDFGERQFLIVQTNADGEPVYVQNTVDAEGNVTGSETFDLVLFNNQWVILNDAGYASQSDPGGDPQLLDLVGGQWIKVDENGVALDAAGDSIAKIEDQWVKINDLGQPISKGDDTQAVGYIQGEWVRVNAEGVPTDADNNPLTLNESGVYPDDKFVNATLSFSKPEPVSLNEIVIADHPTLVEGSLAFADETGAPTGALIPIANIDSSVVSTIPEGQFEFFNIDTLQFLLTDVADLIALADPTTAEISTGILEGIRDALYAQTGESYVIYGRGETELVALINESVAQDVDTTLTTYEEYTGLLLDGETPIISQDQWDIVEAGARIDGIDLRNDLWKDSGALELIQYANEKIDAANAQSLNVSVLDLDQTENGFAINGTESATKNGFSVSILGDINGDGYDDILVAAPDADSRTEADVWETNVDGSFKRDENGQRIALTVKVNAISDEDLYLEPITDASGKAEQATVMVDGVKVPLFYKNADGEDSEIPVYQTAANFDADGNLLTQLVFDGNGDPIIKTDLDLGALVKLVTNPDDPDAGEVVTELSYKATGIDGEPIPMYEVDGSEYQVDVLGEDGKPITFTETLIDNGESYVIFGGDFTDSVLEANQGTAGDDTLQGTENAEVLLGGEGIDLLIGDGGADVLKGGSGDDAISVADGEFALVDGGHGYDTLIVTGDIDLDFSNLDMLDNRVEGIEAIDAGVGNTLTLGLNDVLDMTDGLNKLDIIGDASNLILNNFGDNQIAGEWIKTGTGTFGADDNLVQTDIWEFDAGTADSEGKPGNSLAIVEISTAVNFDAPVDGPIV